MLDPELLNVWTWQGRIGRARYLGSVLILLGVNHNLNRLLSALWGYPWPYFFTWRVAPYRAEAPPDPFDTMFYTIMLSVALPFIWAGVTLTLRRLRDVNLPLWVVLLFFVPFLNVIFFFILAAIPSQQSANEESGLPARVGRFIPESKFGSAIFGIALTTILALLEIALSANELANYGWGLFVGVPFFLGLNSSLICGFHRPRSLSTCLMVAMLSVLFVGLALFGFALEGIICLAMAVPLALVIALVGGFIGYVIQKRSHYSANALHVVSVGALLIPGLILIEYAVGATPPVYEVKTAVVIKSDPQTVWKHVVSSSQLPPPTEAMFKTGLAYPIRCEMQGEGVGAGRHCMFSTGPFVESITVWNEPRLLAFDVSSQPPAMKELSIYSDVHPPHLDNYFVAQRGQFALKPLPDGTTLLEGTTWYQNRYWPAPYWRLWSDYIVGRLHEKVLLHIKSLAETDHEEAQKAQK
jgi:uncharacterized membrane protein YhaH (DUF805 family)